MTETKIKLNSVDDVKKFVAIVNDFTYDVDLISGKYVVDAKSIMGIFSLDLSKPLSLVAHTYDSDEFLSDIKDFVV